MERDRAGGTSSLTVSHLASMPPLPVEMPYSKQNCNQASITGVARREGLETHCVPMTPLLRVPGQFVGQE